MGWTRTTYAIGLVDGARTLAVRSYLERVTSRLAAELHILSVGAQEKSTKLGAGLPRRGRKSLLIDRYGQRCQGCGQLKSEKDLEVDHIKPKSAGGPDAIQNRTLLCGPCNRLKSHELTLDELHQRRLKDGLMDSDWWKEQDRISPNTSASVFGEFDLAEWGGKLRVRALTGPEKCILWKLRRGFGPRMYEPGDAAATAVAFATVDEGGRRVFTDGDISTLGKKSAAPLYRLYNKILDLSRS